MTHNCLGLIFVLVVGTGLSLPSAQTQQATPTLKDAGAEAEIRRLSADEVQAFLRRDADAMARLWSDDFVVTNPLNQFVTKQKVLEMVKSGILVITSFDRQIEYVKSYGDTVIVAGHETVVWGGRMPNAGRTEHLRITAVWMKREGRWQQVARHANIVPDRVP